MLANFLGRRTQVVKGEVCKTSMQRFESARRLHFPVDITTVSNPRPLLTKEISQVAANNLLADGRLSPAVKRILRENRCYLSVKVEVTRDLVQPHSSAEVYCVGKIKSRHTANETLKQVD